MKVALIALVTIAPWAVTVVAADEGARVTAGLILSIQPAGACGSAPSSPCPGLGGTVPGGFVAVDHTWRTAVLAVEVSVTKPLERLQRFSGVGCFPTPCTLLGRHDDTIVASFAGLRVAVGTRVAVVPKAGVAFVSAKDTKALGPALGGDMVVRMGRRVSAVSTLRYIRVTRDFSGKHAGLGSDIFRIGAGVRLGW